MMNRSLSLLIDLYELTMMQAYYEEGMTEEAVFSLFVRRLPARRNFLIACGLDAVLDYLESLRFTEGDLEYLGSQEEFSAEFLDRLRQFRFTGEVHAVAEGTPVFAEEPLVEVVAPMPQAQIVETFLMNQVHLQTVLASKAHRVVTAAEGRPVVDFGLRRMHGIDAGLKGARAFYIGGVAATSNVLAGQRYGVPITGTMAHSYIQAHEDEMEAFRAFTRCYPETVLLVDTYDVEDGVCRVIGLAEELGEEFHVRAVRLDSGDLLLLSRKTRRLLDRAGLEWVKIFASGGLDEDKISELISSGAPIDGFGVGTGMGVSGDSPALDIAYKLCQYAGKGCLKLSAGKPVLPGRKQVFRAAADGRDVGDLIGLADEDLPGQPLLEAVMRDGQRVAGVDGDIESVRDHARQQIARLPDHVRAVEPAEPPYLVEVSPELIAYQKRLEDEAKV